MDILEEILSLKDHKIFNAQGKLLVSEKGRLFIFNSVEEYFEMVDSNLLKEFGDEDIERLKEIQMVHKAMPITSEENLEIIRTLIVCNFNKYIAAYNKNTGIFEFYNMKNEKVTDQDIIIDLGIIIKTELKKISEYKNINIVTV